MAKPAKAPSMPFYGKDIYTDEATLRLSFAAQGLYMRLLWWQWAEGSVPDDVEALSIVLGRARELAKLWAEVRPFFAPFAPGRVANRKLENIRAEMVRVREKRAGSGSKGGSKAQANRVANEEANGVAKTYPAFASASAVASAVPNQRELTSLPATPVTLELPKDGVAALEIIRWVLGILAPRLQWDDFAASGWLSTFTPDPWLIAAAFCDAFPRENPAAFAEKTNPRYFTTVLATKFAEGYTLDNPREYTEHVLRSMQRQRGTAA